MPRLSLSSADPRPVIGIYSFATKKGNFQPGAQFEFDVQLLRDPAGQKQFAGMNGTAQEVRDWLRRDVRVQPIIDLCRLIADDLVKVKQIPNSSRKESLCTWLSFAFKDHHGKWIGPAIAEIVGDALSNDGYGVAVVHHVLNEEQANGSK